MENRSKAILGMEDSAFARSLFKSMGYTDSELKEGKPLIGIANTWNTLVPGHYNLDKVAEYVKNGIYAAGGTAVEFGTIAACDGVAQGHEGMHYILPSREIICDSVEIMAQAHRLDGLVLLASCDKIVPAMLMAAARLDIPCIVCVGGPMLGGIEFDGRKSDLTSISEALGMLKAGKITECEYNSLENTACPGCGSCSFLGTANTMCCVSEALGMTLPGGALIPAAYAGRLRHSFESGRAIVELCKKGITARQILTKEAIRNAIKVTMAICGSTNAVLHLPAIANEAELDMNVLEEFEALTKTTPQIAKVNPAAKPEMEAFYRAGGIPRVMQHLGGLLDTSVMTVSGKTLAENLAGYVYEYPEDPTIIKTVEEPFSKTGGVAVLHGNLCPRTAVSKPGAIDPSMHHFVGKAKCYNSEEEAEEAILGGKIQAGDVVVIRYEGPKGGPGMREMFKAMKYMYGVGLSKSAALITDGRFSGTNNGCFVGHISPEAAVPYLTVVNVERQSSLQDVAYSVEYVDDPDMYQGDYEVLSKGVYGKADVTANVTVINGTETAREVVSSVTLKEPVAERQARGTKERPTWFPTGSFRWPCYGVITSYFGGRNTGISGASSYHEAIDIANSYGTPIYAADGGTVIYSGWNGGLGYCVKIDHGNGFITWYGHNSDLYVSVGDHVYKGQTIAAMGSTGISSGSHCDFRVQRNGTMVDPLNYLP